MYIIIYILGAAFVRNMNKVICEDNVKKMCAKIKFYRRSNYNFITGFYRNPNRFVENIINRAL